jgi:hypothetical protein
MRAVSHAFTIGNVIDPTGNRYKPGFLLGGLTGQSFLYGKLLTTEIRRHARCVGISWCRSKPAVDQSDLDGNLVAEVDIPITDLMSSIRQIGP